MIPHAGSVGKCAIRVDPRMAARNNTLMTTEQALPFSDAIPADLDADTQAVIAKLTRGIPLDSETLARIRGEAERIRAEIQLKHGVLDIGVPAIRQLRDS